MSVTNPERVVTKQDLADFYETILPYLGGMPEMVANKFSKGDLYSTDEKMIGQWIDGKPVYQKVVDATAYTMTNSGTTDIPTNLTTVDTLISLEGMLWHSDGGYWRGMPMIQDNDATRNSSPYNFNKSTGIVSVSTRSNAYSNAFSFTYIIIQYTKTTDSAVSIGNDTDYSTTEKIVGTWVDGKPIWQKTFHDDSWEMTVTSTLQEVVIVSPEELSALNIDKVLANFGTASWNSADQIILPFTVNISNSLNINVDTPLFNPSTGIKLRGWRNSGSSLLKSIYITVQYTKTTS